MNIGIIGVGGVGGYFGGKICHHLERSKPYFIARGKHLEEIRKKGLHLTTADEGEIVCYPRLATDDFNSLPVLDICFLCVKVYDLHDVLLQLKSKVSPNTQIVPLLNGVDIYERVRNVLHEGKIFPACVYVGTHIQHPGKVIQKGGSCIIHFGKDPVDPIFVPEEVLQVFQTANIGHNWLEDAGLEIWKKYLFIAPFALVTAAFEKTIGEAMSSKKLKSYIRALIIEIASLAASKGIKLMKTIVDETMAKGNEFPFETKTSLQRDVELRDKPDERDLFGGTVLRMGKQLGLSTPVTQEIFEKLNVLKPPV